MCEEPFLPEIDFQMYLSKKARLLKGVDISVQTLKVVDVG